MREEDRQNKKIKRFFIILVMILLLSFSFSFALAAGEETDFGEIPGNPAPPFPVSPDHRFGENGPVLVMFYNTNCGDCIRTLPFVQQYVKAHPELESYLLDIRENFEYWKLFSVYKEAYGTGAIPVPTIFVGDKVLTGYEDITGSLDDAVRAQVNGKSLQEKPIQGILGDISMDNITLPLVATAGLADGINPCAFSVLIILLFTLSTAGSRRKMVIVGTCFICTVFIFYFLSGLGIFYVIQLAEISRAIGIIAAGIAFILGTISIFEGIRGEDKSSLGIPQSRRGVIGKYIEKASVPASIILGVLVGMFELPCTGGIYLAILSLISDKMTLAEGIPLLLVYNVFFVLPLVLILCAVVIGLPLEIADRWRQEHRSAVRIIMGIVLVGLGLLLVSSFLVLK